MNVIWRSEVEMPNSVGSMNPTATAIRPPDRPANPAANVNATSLVRPSGMPSAWAAKALWRTALKARPNRDLCRLSARNTAKAAAPSKT